MKKWAMTLILIVGAMCTNGHAAPPQSTVDVSNLTPQQIAEIQAKVAELQPSAVVKVSSELRAETSKWAELGSGAAIAIVAAAKELGVAANEFVQTPLGTGVAVIVAYKIVGRDILGVIVGSAVIIFGYSLALWIVTTRRWYEDEYKYVPTCYGLFNRKVITKRAVNSTVFGNAWFIFFVLVALTSVVGLNLIF